MEEAHDQYQLMMMNKKHILMNSHIGLSSYDSWEEQAFAEDAAAAGVHGGCVWPPRSYSCSFCGREFKSAQALGGHMNIHRRDRAKLKQSLNNNETDHHPHHHHHHLHPQINHGPGSVSSPLSPSGFSAFSILQGHGGNAVTDSKAELEIEKNDQTIEEESTFQQSHVETDLSVRSLNSVTRRRRLDDNDDDDDDDDGEATVGFKRPKTVVFSSLLPFFLKPCSQQSRPNQPELVVLGPKLSSMHVDDNIDLELRLGDLPKVK